MTRLTEEMVIARTRANDIGSIRKLNVWGSGLTDVSLLRKMQSVEVLSLSVNKIGSLSDFQWCRNLQELYVRRNEIRDLNQVCYLRDLPRLRSLWLDENPCSSCELYRVTVLRALPHLQKLDNVPVAPEEVQDALRRGVELCHPEDARANEVPQQHQHQHQHQQQQQVPMPDSRQHSPARQEEYEIGPYYDDYEDPTPPRRPAQHFQHQRRHASLSSLFASTQRSPPRRHAPSDPDSEPEAQQPGGRRPPDDLFYDTDRRNANYEPDATPGYGRAVNNQYHNNIYDRGPHTDAGESPSPADELSSSLASPGSSLLSQTPSKDTTPGSEDYSHGHARGAARTAGRGGRADTCSSDSSASAGSGSGSGSGGSGGSGSYLAARRGPPGGHAGEEEPAARGDERDRRPPAQLDLPASQRCSPAPLGPAALGVQPLPPPGSRRPVPRVWNSNILSAVLCLIKELDFPSLEVVEVAVRSRMEEF